MRGEGRRGGGFEVEVAEDSEGGVWINGVSTLDAVGLASGTWSEASELSWVMHAYPMIESAIAAGLVVGRFRRASSHALFVSWIGECNC